MSGDECRLEVLRVTVDACSKQADSLADTWKVLETKAQATVVTAGIFIAAIVSVTKDGTPHKPVASFFLIACLLLLAFTIWTAILALLVRSIAAAPGADEYNGLATDLLPFANEELEARLSGFYINAISLWIQSVDELRRTNAEKAGFLYAAQMALFAASIFATVLAVTRLA